MVAMTDSMTKNMTAKKLGRGLRWRYEFVSIVIVLAGVVFAAALVIFATHSDKRLINTINLATPIDIAAISADGNLVASVATKDKATGAYRIDLCRANDGSKLASTSPGSVYALSFSPDNKLLAASGNDGVRLFRTSDGSLFREFKGQQLFSVAFSLDGQRVAAAGAQGVIQIWGLADPVPSQTLNPGKPITSIAFSPDGKLIAAGSASSIGLVLPKDVSSEENPIFIYPLDRNQPPSVLRGHKYGTLALAFSPDGKTLVSGGSDGFLQFWSVGDQKLLKRISADAGWFQFLRAQAEINQVSFSPDGLFVAAAISNSQILLLPAENTKPKRSLAGHTDSVLSIHFEKSRLISVGQDSTIRIWDLAEIQ